MRVFLDALSRVPTVSVGTQALIIGSMEMVEKQFPGTEFVMLSSNEKVDKWFLNSERFRVRLVRRSSSQYGTIRDILSVARGVDLIVSAWGDGYITSPAHRLANKTLFLRSGRRPAILFPSSLGPFSGNWKRVVAKFGLSAFDLLMARDTITFEYLKDLGLSGARLVPDTAFIVEPADDDRVNEIVRSEGIPVDERFIGVNVSQLLRVLFSRRGEDYGLFVAELCEFLRESFGLRVLLIPHQVYPSWFVFNKTHNRDSFDGDDRHAINEVMESLRCRGIAFPVMGEYSAREYKGLIGRCSMVVGGRMHSIIAALSSGVPSVLIQYSHKSPGVMKMLGMEKCLWPYESRKEELMKTLEYVWFSQKDLRKFIQERVAALKREVWLGSELMAQCVENYRQG